MRSRETLYFVFSAACKNLYYEKHNTQGEGGLGRF